MNVVVIRKFPLLNLVEEKNIRQTGLNFGLHPFKPDILDNLEILHIDS